MKCCSLKRSRTPSLMYLSFLHSQKIISTYVDWGPANAEQTCITLNIQLKTVELVVWLFYPYEYGLK